MSNFKQAGTIVVFVVAGCLLVNLDAVADQFFKLETWVSQNFMQNHPMNNLHGPSGRAKRKRAEDAAQDKADGRKEWRPGVDGQP